MQTALTLQTADTQVELDLDARLALVGAVMDERCKLAVLAISVNTAHIPDADPIPEITAPIPLTPATAPCPYPTPIAATLYKARLRLETAGWCTGSLRDEKGANCLIGAIRAEAASCGEADDACVLLLEAIRRDFPHAETLPTWNDTRKGPRQPLLYLDQAAALAHARLI